MLSALGLYPADSVRSLSSVIGRPSAGQNSSGGCCHGEHMLTYCCLLCIRPCLAMTLKGISVLGPPFNKEKKWSYFLITLNSYDDICE